MTDITAQLAAWLKFVKMRMALAMARRLERQPREEKAGSGGNE